MLTSDPVKFSDWFNATHPGTWRKIDAVDVTAMKSCGLIGLYQYFSQSLDGETVRKILNYENMIEKRFLRQD